jgi:O-antigen ligase
LDTSFSQSTRDAPFSPANWRGRILILLDCAIFYGLLAVITLTAIPYGTVDAWSQALFQCSVFFLALLWLVHGFIEGSWHIGNTRLVVPMVGLVILAIAQSITLGQTNVAGKQVGLAISADPFETWIFAFRVAALVLAIMLMTRFITKPARLGVLVHAIIALAVASALFGIARQAMQHGQGFVLSRLNPEQGFGQFINKNHFAFLMEMAVGLVIGVAFLRRGRSERVLLYLSALLLMAAAVVLSRSRAGLLTLAVQFIFAALLFVSSRKFAGEKHLNQKPGMRWTRSIVLSVVMIGALPLVIGGGVVWLGGDQLTTGVETANSELAGVDVSELHEGARRRDIWRAAWRMFEAHPIAGAGLGGFWAEIPVYHSASGVLTPQQAHNDYLELLASGGVLGAGLFVWFAVMLIREARKSVNAPEGIQRSVMLGAVIAMVGVGVHSIFDFGLHITINAAVFAMLLAMLRLNSGSRTMPNDQLLPTA